MTNIKQGQIQDFKTGGGGGGGSTRVEGASFLGGSGGMPPEMFWKFVSLKCPFPAF